MEGIQIENSTKMGEAVQNIYIIYVYLLCVFRIIGKPVWKSNGSFNSTYYYYRRRPAYQLERAWRINVWNKGGNQYEYYISDSYIEQAGLIYVLRDLNETKRKLYACVGDDVTDAPITLPGSN